MIPLPPLLGAVHDTVTEAWPAVATTPVGALGGPVGVTAFDGAEDELVPIEFVAVTVKV